MANQRSARHQSLLKYLTRVVAEACPSYLRKDGDDIIQTVLIRLDGKLAEILDSLRTCHALLHQGGPDSHLEFAATLRSCLREIGKACERNRTQDVKLRLESCLPQIRGSDGPTSFGDALHSLEKSLSWFQEQGLREVFAESYIKKGIHWAILDARKKHVRLAEVSPEEREDGSSDWDALAGSVPDHRSLVIREAISDCLSQLDEAKRRPTYLALMGYVYSEIAEFLDLSLPQADSRIRRGRKFLRNCLKSKGVSP